MEVMGHSVKKDLYLELHAQLCQPEGSIAAMTGQCVRVAFITFNTLLAP